MSPSVPASVPDRSPKAVRSVPHRDRVGNIPDVRSRPFRAPSTEGVLFAVPDEQPGTLYPTQAELLAAARSCSWPSVLVRPDGRDRPLRLAGTPQAWSAFILASGPDTRLAAWEALETWEQQAALA